jgi:hypothetical protein
MHCEDSRLHQPKKTWVLDRAPRHPAKKTPAASGEPGDSRTPQRGFRRPKATGSGLKVFLSYVLGPCGLLVFEEGRQSGFWTALSVISGLGWVLIAVLGLRLLGSQDPRQVLMMLAALGLFAVIGCVVWSRGVWQAGTAPGWSGFPSWLAHPLPVLLLGLLVPGLGIFVARSRRLGAACLGLIGLLAFPLLVLLMAPEIWGRIAETQGVFGVKVELLFILASVAVLILVAAWILQAVSGTMMAGASRAGAGFMGNGLGFILVAAVVALALSFQPRTLASQMDDYAVALGQDGFRVIPLRLCQLATRLDPVEHLYPMHTAGFHEALGDAEAARRIRAGLEIRWEAYTQARLQALRVGMKRRPLGVLDSMPAPPVSTPDESE